MSTNKMGRPLKENEPLAKSVSIRFTEKTYKALEEKSAENKKSIADNVRDMVQSVLEEEKK